MNIKKFVNPFLVLLSIILSYYSGYFIGRLYIYLFPGVGGGLYSVPTDAAAFFVGWPLQFIFLITLLFTIFGGSKKKWWIGILLAPITTFWIIADPISIFSPVAVGLVGWGLGVGVERVIKLMKKRSDKMQ